MQIMTKINDFEEIFFKSSIIFHVFAHSKRLYHNDIASFFIYNFILNSLNTIKFHHNSLLIRQF